VIASTPTSIATITIAEIHCGTTLNTSTEIAGIGIPDNVRMSRSRASIHLPGRLINDLG
jgi:hypothetical protein